MVAIRISHLTKRFTEKTAVNDVSFDLGEHEFLVLVGPSGCGKTTTLRMLAGLEPSSSGDIYFGTRRVNEIRPKDRNVAMVFQDYAIFPHLTVYDNIAYGLRSRGAPRDLIHERVTTAAKTFRIDQFLERKPRQLSGGERQRVALSRAMVRDADLFLYDEPLSNLDAQLRHQAREDIVALHQKKQKPSVYVTHDQSEAMAMGDRIAVMRDGKIEQIGTGGELYKQPANLFVAYFIGTPSINLFDVTIQLEADGLYAVNPGLRVRLPDEAQPALHTRINQKVKLGLRPEDLHSPKLAPFTVTEHNQLRGLVNVIEPSSMGCAVYLSTLEDNAQDFTATFRTRLPVSYLGKEIPLALHLEKAHFFDPDTGASLWKH